jgi:tetratricopeptide (TPR) repeat protein
MSTMVKLKISFRAPAGSQAAGGTTRPLVGATEPVYPVTGGSTDARAFLAMYARQKKVAARVRWLKRTVLVAGMAAAAGFALKRSSSKDSAGAGNPPALAAVSAVTPPPAAAVLAEPVAAPAPVLPAAEPTALAAAAPAAAGAAVASALATSCETDFSARHWRAAVESCAAAFDAGPDAALALKVAHAHFATDAVERAGSWAEKAVELGTADADAFVLIGHAERQANHPNRALAAYRRYLRASPQGWHAKSVRALVRDLKRVTAVAAGDAPGTGTQ